MDLLGVLRSCVRRWYVFLPILVLTAWLGRDQYRQAQPEYTSTATVVIAPSTELVYNRGRQTDSGLVVTSPFNGGEGPRVLAGLLVRALNTATVRQQLLPAGGAAITASRNVQEDSTVVVLQVVAGSAKADAGALDAVRKGSDGVLAKIQYDAGAPEGQLYNAVSGGPVDPPLVTYPDQVRGVVAIGLAGVLLAVVLSVVAQSLMAGRHSRKEKPVAKALKPDKAPRAPREPRDAREGRQTKPSRASSKRGPGRRSHAADDGARGAGHVAPHEEVDLREPQTSAWR